MQSLQLEEPLASKEPSSSMLPRNPPKQRKKKNRKPKENSPEGPTEECILCCQRADIFGTGQCRHPACKLFLSLLSVKSRFQVLSAWSACVVWGNLKCVMSAERIFRLCKLFKSHRNGRIMCCPSVLFHIQIVRSLTLPLRLNTQSMSITSWTPLFVTSAPGQISLLNFQASLRWDNIWVRNTTYTSVTSALIIWTFCPKIARHSRVTR